MFYNIKNCLDEQTTPNTLFQMCRSNLMATQRDNGRETEIKGDKVRERERECIYSCSCSSWKASQITGRQGGSHRSVMTVSFYSSLGALWQACPHHARLQHFTGRLFVSPRCAPGPCVLGTVWLHPQDKPTRQYWDHPILQMWKQ